MIPVGFRSLSLTFQAETFFSYISGHASSLEADRIMASHGDLHCRFKTFFYISLSLSALQLKVFSGTNTARDKIKGLRQQTEKLNYRGGFFQVVLELGKNFMK